MNLSDIIGNAINTALGVNATYTHTSVTSTESIKGIYENGFVDALNVASTKPIFKILTSSLSSAPALGDTILIAITESTNKNFMVVEIRPDNTDPNAITLFLEEI